MSDTKIIIPARYGSSRLPGKPLKLLCGKELILHVAERCRKVLGNKYLFIATDSSKIKKKVKENKFNVIMTSKKCLTGTDRVAQASKKIRGKIFINVQGDEPLINPSDIKKIINAKKKFPNHVICGYAKVSALENSQNRNIPKVVMNKESELIYISRANIPSTKNKNKKIDYLKQVCVYAFNKNELNKFYKLKQKSKLEKIEDIEILRFFELNIKIKMIKLNENTIAVDEIKDIYKVEKILQR
jgi:3-deoxy-manno-octulosonate cytidylyltransferase (CMP-KDO synthetase)